MIDDVAAFIVEGRHLKTASEDPDMVRIVDILDGDVQPVQAGNSGSAFQ